MCSIFLRNNLGDLGGIGSEWDWEKRISEAPGNREGDQFGRALKRATHDIVKENWNLYHMLSVMDNKDGIDPALNTLKP